MNIEPSIVEEPSPTNDAVSPNAMVSQRHRKSSSTGGGRAWSEEEVRVITQVIANYADQPLGGIPHRDSHAQNAL